MTSAFLFSVRYRLAALATAVALVCSVVPAQAGDEVNCMARVLGTTNYYSRGLADVKLDNVPFGWVRNGAIERYVGFELRFYNAVNSVEVSGCPADFVDADNHFRQVVHDEVNTFAAHPNMFRLYGDVVMFMVRHHELFERMISSGRLPDEGSADDAELRASGSDAFTSLKSFITWRFRTLQAMQDFNNANSSRFAIYRAYGGN